MLLLTNTMFFFFNVRAFLLNFDLILFDLIDPRHLREYCEVNSIITNS